MELSEWREELARETCSASREHSGGSGYHDAGTRHIFDMDKRRYVRLPGENRQSFAGDDRWLDLTQIDQWPRVDDIFFIWLEGVTWRRSSLIRSISKFEETTGPSSDS